MNVNFGWTKFWRKLKDKEWKPESSVKQEIITLYWRLLRARMVLVSIPSKVYGTKTKICDKCYTSSPYARPRFMHYKAQYLTSTVYRPQCQEWTAILAGISLAIAKKQKWSMCLYGRWVWHFFWQNFLKRTQHEENIKEKEIINKREKKFIDNRR